MDPQLILQLDCCAYGYYRDDEMNDKRESFHRIVILLLSEAPTQSAMVKILADDARTRGILNGNRQNPCDHNDHLRLLSVLVTSYFFLQKEVNKTGANVRWELVVDWFYEFQSSYHQLRQREGDETIEIVLSTIPCPVKFLFEMRKVFSPMEFRECFLKVYRMRSPRKEVTHGARRDVRR